MTNVSIPQRVKTAMDMGIHRRPSGVNLTQAGPGPLGLHCVWSPPEPLVDIIFVHGMGGGSYKTWRKDPSRQNQFWPGEWLPKDDNFSNARIHTFGYDADWSEGHDSALDMEMVGNNLHAEMIASEHLCRGPKTPIMLVGHDMGGIAIKQAWLEFHREMGDGVDLRLAGIAHRIRCMMFLATPHHGADNPERLHKILLAAGIQCNIKKLSRSPPRNDRINQEFSRINKSFTIFSFYETEPMAQHGLIVDKDCALIGSGDEISVPLRADHRSMSKFDYEHDVNYRTILNHMSREIDELLQCDSGPESEDSHPLSVYLACEESQDEMLESFLDNKADRSCEWIQHRQSFAKWKRPSREPTVSIYWLYASPGAGKSYMSAHVTQHLQRSNASVSYFFFVDGVLRYRTVACLVRSLALQMSEQDDTVKRALQQMQRENIHLDEDDEKALWRNLFINRIFSLNLNKTVFWVVDALDECADHTKLFGLLKLMRPHYSIRIFITSRPSAEFRTQFSQLPQKTISVNPEEIYPEDTQQDIKLMLVANKALLPDDDEDGPNNLVDRIVRSSKGSFLWANVVMNEVQNAFTRDMIEEILNEIPAQMEEHYEKILEQTMSNPRHQHLIKAMLVWAVCSMRHLSLDEFQIALKLDINADFPRNGMAKAIEALCGQLLRVDRTGEMHHVHLIHTTVREFLLSKTHSKASYAIRREDGHLRLATTCLNFLLSNEFRAAVQREALSRTKTHETSPATRFDLGRARAADKTSVFAEYAASAFSYHIVNGPRDNKELFNLLDRFLNHANVLHWIEYVALVFDSLDHVREAGANLRRLLDRRGRHSPNVGEQLTRIKNWATDLIRIVAKFGRNIREAPAQIKQLVPALCPTSSMIYQRFGRGTAENSSGLRVVGMDDEIWADAISYIEHIGSYPTCIACNDRFIVIGYRSHEVHIFDASSCDEITTFKLDETPRQLAFDNTGNKLITAGERAVHLWSLEDLNQPHTPWSIAPASACIGFYFTDSDDYVVAATKGSVLEVIPVDDDSPDQPQTIPLGNQPNQRRASMPLQEAIAVSFSPDGALVAMAYMNRPLSIWNVDDGSFFKEITSGGKEDLSNLSVEKVLFNPNRDIPLLAVTYREGQMLLYKYDHNFQFVKAVDAEPFALTSTPDGRTLASGDAKGSIQLWDFETLTMLYRINYNSHPVRDLVFSSDGLRLIDIRETHTVVWEPAALIRESSEDDRSNPDSSTILTALEEVPKYIDPVEITALDVHHDQDLAFVGKSDGSLSLYHLDRGRLIEKLHTLSDKTQVTHIQFNGAKDQPWLSGADSNGLVVLIRLDQSNRNVETFMYLDHGLGQTIRQLLFSKSGKHLLISSPSRAQHWKLAESDDGFRWVCLGEFRTPDHDCWKFFAGKVDPDNFQLLDKGIEAFVPQELRKGYHTGTEKDLNLHRSSNHIRNVVSDDEFGYVVVEYECARATTQLVILQRTNLQRPSVSYITVTSDGTGVGSTSSPSAAKGVRTPHASSNGLLGIPSQLPPGQIAAATAQGAAVADADCYEVLAHLRANQIKMFLGIYDGKVVYLGPQLWVRTVDLHHLLPKAYVRKHFFVPHEYIGGNHRVQAMVGRRGEVVFPRRGELVVVFNGVKAFDFAGDDQTVSA